MMLKFAKVLSQVKYHKEKLKELEKKINIKAEEMRIRCLTWDMAALKVGVTWLLKSGRCNILLLRWTVEGVNGGIGASVVIKRDVYIPKPLVIVEIILMENVLKEGVNLAHLF